MTDTLLLSTATTSTSATAGASWPSAAVRTPTCPSWSTSRSPPSRVVSRHGRRRHRPGDPRRRGRARPAAWASPSSSRTRSTECPPVLVADRPAAGRLAGDLVAGRGARAAPDRPGPAGRGGRRTLAAPRVPVQAAEPMGERTWPEVLGALVAGRGPDHRRRPPGRWARSSPARPRRPRSPASPSRCAPRARPSTRSPAWSRRCTPSRRRRSPSRGRASTSSAPAATGPRRQHLHDGRDRRRRRRRAGGQARQPLGLLAGRLRRRARGARHPARPRPRRGRPLSPRRSASPSASPPRFHPGMRHAAVPRRELGVADRFNFLGPLANPAQPTRPGDRLRRPADGAGDGRRARRAAASTPGCSAATTGSTS